LFFFFLFSFFRFTTAKTNRSAAKVHLTARAVPVTGFLFYYRRRYSGIFSIALSASVPRCKVSLTAGTGPISWPLFYWLGILCVAFSTIISGSEVDFSTRTGPVAGFLFYFTKECKLLVVAFSTIVTRGEVNLATRASPIAWFL
jgi:hypothetical protein